MSTLWSQDYNRYLEGEGDAWTWRSSPSVLGAEHLLSTFAGNGNGNQLFYNLNALNYWKLMKHMYYNSSGAPRIAFYATCKLPEIRKLSYCSMSAIITTVILSMVNTLNMVYQSWPTILVLFFNSHITQISMCKIKNLLSNQNSLNFTPNTCLR